MKYMFCCHFSRHIDGEHEQGRSHFFYDLPKLTEEGIEEAISEHTAFGETIAITNIIKLDE